VKHLADLSPLPVVDDDDIVARLESTSGLRFDRRKALDAFDKFVIALSKCATTPSEGRPTP
jgi:hypothetical protein